MMDKVHIVFDSYDIPISLKEATRIRRQGMQTPVEHHITDTTNIAKISQAKLLSHPKTKHQLTATWDRHCWMMHPQMAVILLLHIGDSVQSKFF